MTNVDKAEDFISLRSIHSSTASPFSFFGWFAFLMDRNPRKLLHARAIPSTRAIYHWRVVH